MPTRYLKPGVRDSEVIDACSPLAECLFYRLLVTVDDFGRYDARPAMVKSHCFPIKESVSIKKCDELLAELERAGLIALYSVDGKPFLQMCKWDSPPRSKESKYPAPAGECMQMHASARSPHAHFPVTVTETVTETGTVTEKKTRSAGAALPCPDSVDPKVWADFLAIRKAKRSPLTSTALALIEAEARKAGIDLQEALSTCCARGWQGFKAEWLAKASDRAVGARTQAGQGAGLESFRERDARLAADRVAAFAPGVAARRAHPLNVIDMEARDVPAIEGH